MSREAIVEVDDLTIYRTDGVSTGGVRESVLLPLRSVKGELIRCKDCKHRPSLNGEYNNGFDLDFPTYRCPCRCDDEYYSWMPDDEWFVRMVKGKKNAKRG